jgi:hypothetical protein
MMRTRLKEDNGIEAGGLSELLQLLRRKLNRSLAIQRFSDAA